MKMKNCCLKFVLNLIISNLIFVSCENSKSINSYESRMESVQDRIITIQDSVVWEIPEVSRLCDEINLKKSRVSIGDCELYVEEEGKGIPIVLLHGGPGSTHHDFHPAFSEASKFARIVYYDQRGCGLSDHIPGDDGYSVEQAADDLDKLRVQLGIEKWVVAGHSYGGFLAQYYTTLYPESVLGLVIICGSTGLHFMDVSRQYDYLTLEERSTMWRLGSEIRDAGKEKGLSDRDIMALTVYNNYLNGDWKRQSFYRPSIEGIARIALYNWDHDLELNFNRQMSRSAKSISLAGAFTNSPIPTMIMESVWDLTWSEAKTMVLAKNHPNAGLVVFSKSAHAPYDDEPQAFFNSLKKFVTSIKPIPTDKLQEYSIFMKNFQPSVNDVFLSGQISPEESKSLDEFQQIKTRIIQGEKYFDLSTPLRVHLSFLSAIKHKDLISAQKVQSRNWTLESLANDFYWFDEISIWRAPIAPDKPQTGQIWPVYITNSRTGRWEDTLMFIFWDGQWQRAGNQGGPYYDWRDSELFFIKAELRKRN